MYDNATKVLAANAARVLAVGRESNVPALTKALGTSISARSLQTVGKGSNAAAEMLADDPIKKNVGLSMWISSIAMTLSESVPTTRRKRETVCWQRDIQHNINTAGMLSGSLPTYCTTSVMNQRGKVMIEKRIPLQQG